MTLLPPEAERALLQAQMDNHILQQMHQLGTSQSGPVYVKPVDSLPFPMPVPGDQEEAKSWVGELIKEAEKLDPKNKRLVCPDHGNPLLPDHGDENVLVCTVIGCTRKARKKNPIKRTYQTGQRYQMPEVLPQPSEEDQYAAFVALVTLPVELDRREKLARGNRSCKRLRILNRMADWQLRHLKEPVFSGSD